jgi:nucleotide sugar dehydrogenase
MLYKRIDPGRIDPPARTIPKIISGLDDICPGSLQSINKLYSKAFQTVIPVSKPEVAEMMKLYENCQRMVGIAYANEMADACLSHGIDPYEVTSMAATKPFGYIPFAPGLGVGGPCIPVNPYYLFSNNSFPLLQLATDRMKDRPSNIARRILSGFEGRLETVRILVIGVAFKSGQSLLTNSPAIDLIFALQNSWRAFVSFVDPLITQSALPQVIKFEERTQWTKSELEKFDVIVLASRQPSLDLSLLDDLEVKVERFVL